MSATNTTPPSLVTFNNSYGYALPSLHTKFQFTRTFDVQLG